MVVSCWAKARPDSTVMIDAASVSAIAKPKNPAIDNLRIAISRSNVDGKEITVVVFACEYDSALLTTRGLKLTSKRYTPQSTHNVYGSEKQFIFGAFLQAPFYVQMIWKIIGISICCNEYKLSTDGRFASAALSSLAFQISRQLTLELGK